MMLQPLTTTVEAEVREEGMKIDNRALVPPAGCATRGMASTTGTDKQKGKQQQKKQQHQEQWPDKEMKAEELPPLQSSLKRSREEKEEKPKKMKNTPDKVRQGGIWTITGK